jgi:hypothetical protein
MRYVGFDRHVVQSTHEHAPGVAVGAALWARRLQLQALPLRVGSHVQRGRHALGVELGLAAHDVAEDDAGAILRRHPLHRPQVAPADLDDAAALDEAVDARPDRAGGDVECLGELGVGAVDGGRADDNPRVDGRVVDGDRRVGLDDALQPFRHDCVDPQPIGLDVTVPLGDDARDARVHELAPVQKRLLQRLAGGVLWHAEAVQDDPQRAVDVECS